MILARQTILLHVNYHLWIIGTCKWSWSHVSLHRHIKKILFIKWIKFSSIIKYQTHVIGIKSYQDQFCCQMQNRVVWIESFCVRFRVTVIFQIVEICWVGRSYRVRSSCIIEYQIIAFRTEMLQYGVEAWAFCHEILPYFDRTQTGHAHQR